MKEPRKVRDHTPGWNQSRTVAPSTGFNLHPATVTESSTTERTGTAEDVELLATRLMGWKRGFHADFIITTEGVLYWRRPPYRESVEWNPLTSADADVQVLERVREVWGDSVNWTRFVVRYASPLVGAVRHSGIGAFVAFSIALDKYRTGDYSHAALAVLKEMEKTEDRG